MAEPVILCHGLLSNRFNVDLSEEASLARHLRGCGMDVWVMELRGHGGSRRASRRGRFDWTLDEYIQQDLPAVVAYVRGVTGARQVHWFGHSLGGMLLYGACALPGIPSQIRSAVVCDAPASFASLRRRTRVGRAYARLIPVVPPAIFLPFLGPAAWLAPWILRRRHGVAGRRLALSLLSNAIIPWGCSRVLLHLCRILEAGRFASFDGSLDYEAGIPRVRFPLRVISAARKLIDERAIHAGFQMAASRDKDYVRLGLERGCAEDYTHSTILVSSTSRHDVYPRVAEWFLRHAGTSEEGGGAAGPADDQKVIA